VHRPSKDPRESTQHLATRIEASIRSNPEDWAGWQKSQYLGG
jgi:lauroyl/myristoyl acyltransferase